MIWQRQAAATFLLAAGLLVFETGVAPAGAQVLTVTGATVIDPLAGAPLGDGVVVMEDGRITAVGPAGDVDVPAGTEVIDARGKYVIPGLMDANLHLYLNLDLETLIKYEGRYHEIVLEAAQLTLKTGQTTVFDTWGPLDPLARARDMINAVWAWGREAYGRLSGRFPDALEALSYRGFRRLAQAHWRTAVEEQWRSLDRRSVVRKARTMLPALEVRDLETWRSGIRAQAVDTDGALVHDFVIREGPGVLNVLNAPSPAATACLAIGRHIADRALRQL